MRPLSLVVAALALALAPRAAVADAVMPGKLDITVPEGWTRQNVLETRAAQEMALLASRSEVRLYAPEAGALVRNLTVIYAELPPKGTPLATVDDFETSIKDALGVGTQLGYERSVDANLLDIHHAVTRGDTGRFYMRRLYAADSAGIVHLAMATCAAGIAEDQEICRRALPSLALALPVNQRQPLDASPMQVPTDSSSSGVLIFAGGAVLAAVIAGVLVLRRRKQPA